jgi:hypothetical protein
VLVCVEVEMKGVCGGCDGQQDRQEGDAHGGWQKRV